MFPCASEWRNQKIRSEVMVVAGSPSSTRSSFQPSGSPAADSSRPPPQTPGVTSTMPESARVLPKSSPSSRASASNDGRSRGGGNLPAQRAAGTLVYRSFCQNGGGMLSRSRQRAACPAASKMMSTKRGRFLRIPEDVSEVDEQRQPPLD